MFPENKNNITNEAKKMEINFFISVTNLKGAPGGIRTPNNRFEACRDIRFTTGALLTLMIFYQNN